MNQSSNEELRCIGCGAVLQTENKTLSGYLPASVLEKNLESGELYCQRCFRLRHYNEVQDVELTGDDFRQMLNEIGETNALVVNVIDIFDFNGSLIPGLHRFVGNNPIVLVGNKVDLLPKSLKNNRMIHWLRQRAHEAGLRPEEVLLTSAVKKHAVQEVMDTIEKLRNGRDVYVVGATNVGKSTLINQIINQATKVENLITTSYFPGTTLGKIEIPLDDGSKLVDTPGIIQPQQMAHFLTAKDLKTITPRKEIKPKVYQLNPEQTLFFGGVARFDYLQGESKKPFVCYISNELPIHRTKESKADELYEKQKGHLLSPPGENAIDNFPPLKKYEFKITEKTDIVFSGLGWVTVEPGATVAGWAPEGVDVLARKALI